MSLPRANKVWGKEIFLHLFVILFTGEVLSQHALQVVSKHALQQGGGSAQGGAWSEGWVILLWGGGGCLVQGGLLLGGPGGDPPGQPLLQAVRILLECIFVVNAVNLSPFTICNKRSKSVHQEVYQGTLPPNTITIVSRLPYHPAGTSVISS